MPTGALAEVSRELGHHMVPYVPKLLPIILRELRCEMSDNRRNSAFAAGTLVSAAPEATSQHALNLLQVSLRLSQGKTDTIVTRQPARLGDLTPFATHASCSPGSEQGRPPNGAVFMDEVVQ